MAALAVDEGARDHRQYLWASPSLLESVYELHLDWGASASYVSTCPRALRLRDPARHCPLASCFNTAPSRSSSRQNFSPLFCHHDRLHRLGCAGPTQPGAVAESVTYRASDMALFTHSNGLYLSEPRDGARFAGIKNLRSPPPSNCLFNFICCRADVVVASACKIEWKAIIKLCHDACETRETHCQPGLPAGSHSCHL